MKLHLPEFLRHLDSRPMMLLAEHGIRLMTASDKNRRTLFTPIRPMLHQAGKFIFDSGTDADGDTTAAIKETAFAMMEDKRFHLPYPTTWIETPSTAALRDRATAKSERRMASPTTPDGRYFVVCGRLWRCSNPHLSDTLRLELVAELMAARRAKQTAMRADDRTAREAARARVDAAKVALGERGPVWWDDGAPDLNRHLARTIPYADWFASLA